MRLRKMAVLIGGTIGTLGLILGGIALLFFGKFNPSPPDPAYPRPADALEAQRQDIDYFGRLMALDRAYSDAARNEARRRLASLSASSVVLDRGRFRIALQQITALADNGHTGLGSKKPVRALLLPVRVTPFPDRLLVTRTTKADADLLGAAVIAIDGQPLAAVLAKLQALRGGTPAWRLNYAQWVLISSEYLHGIGVTPNMDRSTWTFKTASGAIVRRTLRAYRPNFDEPMPDLWRWASSEPVKGDPHDWAVFAPPGDAPFAWRQGDAPFRRAWWPRDCTMYVQLKSNQDENGVRIDDFLTATLADIVAHRPCTIVLDDRFNGGGDYTHTASFASKLPFLVRGRVFILTGVETFSAGITTVVFVKQASRGNVTVLGTPVGDRTQFYSEGNRGCLPNSPFCFHYTTGMHDYRKPCTNWDRCFWLNWIYPAHTDSIAPDETIERSYADFMANRDPVLERALALARSHS